MHQLAVSIAKHPKLIRFGVTPLNVNYIKDNQNLIKEKIFSRIQKIKKLYSRSNVKTAAFLSSGLDSFYLTKLLLENDKNLKLLLSFGFYSNSKDEISKINKTNTYKHKHITNYMFLQKAHQQDVPKTLHF